MTSFKLLLVELGLYKKKDIHIFSRLSRSSLAINFIAVLINKTPFRVLIQKPCDSLYLQFLLGSKEPDFVA